MTVIHGVVIDCADAVGLSAFWRDVLGWEFRMREPGWCSLRNPAGGPHLSFQQVPEGKVVKNRVHLDIRPETGTLLFRWGVATISERYSAHRPQARDRSLT